MIHGVTVTSWSRAQHFVFSPNYSLPKFVLSRIKEADIDPSPGIAASPKRAAIQDAIVALWTDQPESDPLNTRGVLDYTTTRIRTARRCLMPYRMPSLPCGQAVPALVVTCA